IEGRALANDCESFLAGRLAEHLYLRQGGVPVWAWTNLLAHGTVDELRAPPGRFPGLPPVLEPWISARRYLAGEILDVVADGAPLL
uniref:hypothetical protein n=1 Tax=Salmonella sp. SAL4435 TaxID=3159890 RepID=UPI00397DF477